MPSALKSVVLLDFCLFSYVNALNDGDLCYGRCFVPDDPDDSITIHVAGGYDYDGDFRALQNYTWEPSSCWRTSWGTTTST